MKVHYVDPALFRMGGHPFNLAAGCRRAAMARGRTVETYVNKRATPEVIAALGARPVFTFRPRDKVSVDPVSGPLDNLHEKGRRLAGELRTLEVERRDVVVLTLAYALELYAIGCWLARLPREAHPRVCLYLMNDDIPRGSSSLEGILYRFAANWLRSRTEDGRVVLASPTEGFARKLRRWTRFPVDVWYLPVPDPAAEVARTTAVAGALRIALLGNSAPYKGFHLLPRILPRIDMAGRQLQYFVQILPVRGTGHPEVEAALQQALGPKTLPAWRDFAHSDFVKERVQLHPGELDEAAYLAEVRRADVVLLPYNPASYVNKVSGIFMEAAMTGKVLVAPARTWMGEKILAGEAAGVAYDQWNVPEITAAVSKAVATYETLSELARRQAPSWMERGSVSGFMDRVLGS